MAQTFESAKLLPTRAPVWFVCTVSLLLFSQQLWIGESLTTTLIFTMSLVVFFVGFNLLNGLKSIPGILFGLHGLSSIIAHALICVIEGVKVSDDMDPNLDLALVNFFSLVTLTFAAIIYKQTAKSRGILYSTLESINVSPNLPLGIPTLLILAVSVFGLYSNLIPSSLTFLFQISFAATCIVACRMIAENRAKLVAYLAVVFIIAIAWKGHGLSGMKSSLVMPLAQVMLAAALINLRMQWLLITSVLILFACINILAFAIQPLRHLRPGIDNEARLAHAIAYLAIDLERRYSIELPISQPEVKSLIEILRAQSSGQDKIERVGMFSRISLTVDDGKMLRAINERGQIPLEKYFEEFLVIPRAVSGEEFRLDKISAYYGRYAGSIGRFNTDTGIAFSSGTISYAHGGLLFLIVNLFCGGLAIFWLSHLTFGSEAKEYDIGKIWMIALFTSTDIGIEISSLWLMATRKLPIAIASYILIYILCKFANALLQKRSISTEKSRLRQAA
jgi:hypothetical protein